MPPTDAVSAIFAENIHAGGLPYEIASCVPLTAGIY